MNESIMNISGINVCTDISDIPKQPYTLVQTTLIAGTATILSINTIIGNMLVLISFKVDRRLQTVSNYFLLSLAMADLMIGIFSMPLFTAYLLQQEWMLGPIICDLWLALDYLCSNASVLSLLIISFDRFLSVLYPIKYRSVRDGRHAKFMIAGAWFISFLLWPVWIFAWPYIEGKRSVADDECYIQFLETNVYVTVGTAIAAFYLPVVTMIVLYFFVWRETEKRKTYLQELSAENDRTGVNDELTSQQQEISYKNGALQSAESSRSRSWKMRAWGVFSCIDCDPDGGEDENTSPGATTPSTAETPVQSSRATSLTLRPEQIAQLQAALEKQEGMKSSISDNKPATPTGGHSIYTIMIRLPAPVTPQDTEPQPTVTMIADDITSNHPPPLRTCLSTSALVVNSVSDNNMHRYSSTDFLGAARFVHPKHAINKRPKKKKIQRIQEKKHDRKAARTLTAILMAFIITWTPYNVLVLIKSLASCDDIIPENLWNFSYYLCYLNSMINPLCYALANANFRKTYKRILTCTWRRESKLSIIVRGLHARTS